MTVKPGQLVTARSDTGEMVTGIVVSVEKGAFWIETDDGRRLRFAFIDAEKKLDPRVH